MCKCEMIFFASPLGRPYSLFEINLYLANLKLIFFASPLGSPYSLFEINFYLANMKLIFLGLTTRLSLLLLPSPSFLEIAWKQI